MGLFGAYLWYRSGKKKAQRRAQREIDRLEYQLDEALEECDNCGYAAAQHSDEGDCPSYE